MELFLDLALVVVDLQRALLDELDSVFLLELLVLIVLVLVDWVVEVVLQDLLAEEVLELLLGQDRLEVDDVVFGLDITGGVSCSCDVLKKTRCVFGKDLNEVSVRCNCIFFHKVSSEAIRECIDGFPPVNQSDIDEEKFTLFGTESFSDFSALLSLKNPGISDEVMEDGLHIEHLVADLICKFDLVSHFLASNDWQLAVFL